MASIARLSCYFAAKMAASRREPLRAYVAEAPHPVMREVAKLAVARGYTQESLANRWPDGVRAGNIQRHFEARNPREETVRKYADVLGVRPEFLLLLHSHKFEDANALEKQHPDPAGASERYWLNMLQLQFESDEWLPDTAEVVTACLRALPVIERCRLLEVFALAWYREEYFGTPVRAGYAAREDFERVAPVELNLPQRKRERVPGELRFVNLWNELALVLDPDDFDVVIAVVRAMLLKRGIDVAPMDKALADDVLYTQWREGRLLGEGGQ